MDTMSTSPASRPAASASADHAAYLVRLTLALAARTVTTPEGDAITVLRTLDDSANSSTCTCTRPCMCRRTEH